MIRLITLVILMFGVLNIEVKAISITNISVQQRTDGSGKIDVYFDLNGQANSYNIFLEASFDGGITYSPISAQYLSGAVLGIIPGSRKHIVWDGMLSFPNLLSHESKIKITAFALGGGQFGEGVTDIDGNFYPTVIIGDYEWMTENLKTTKYNNGVSIPIVPNQSNWINLTSGAYCWYDNNQTFFETYGALYNWYAVNTGNLCPAGWRVPTDEEWKNLEGFVDTQFDATSPEWDALDWRGYDAGLRLKATIGWALEGNGTDNFGFSGLPGSGRYLSGFGYYFPVVYVGYWWSSTQTNSTYALRRSLNYSNNLIGRGNFNKKDGYSVRCIKN
jgi:uncharacterized protein (TIGR02145 family)